MTTTPAPIRPQDWARMSWHARNRYIDRINAAHREATQPKPTRRHSPPVAEGTEGCWQALIGLLDHALSEQSTRSRSHGRTIAERAREHAEDLSRTDVSTNALGYELGVTPNTIRRWRQALDEVA